MARFTHNCLRDETILRAQERASLRKPSRTIAASPLRRVTASIDERLSEQPKTSVMD